MAELVLIFFTLLFMVTGIWMLLNIAYNKFMEKRAAMRRRP